MFGNQNIFQGPRKNLFDPEVSLRPQCNLFILQSFEILFSIRMSKSGSGILADRADETFPGKEVVGLIGLEPMTPALSRRCSNQLSYRPFFAKASKGEPFPRLARAQRRLSFSGWPAIRSPSGEGWWRHGDSNPRHPACKAGALPTELYPLGASPFREKTGGRVVLLLVSGFQEAKRPNRAPRGVPHARPIVVVIFVLSLADRSAGNPHCRQ